MLPDAEPLPAPVQRQTSQAPEDPTARPMPHGVTARVAASTLNQWALDFDGNLQRTIDSCNEAKQLGARYRVGPELELSGYGCEDHFLEHETTHHSCESLAALAASGVSDGMLVDVGLPFAYRGALYNCRALLLNGKVLLIRPKTALADDLCYREGRWFAAWTPQRLECVQLPPVLAMACAQSVAPFGDALLDLDDVTLGVEMCEELWLPSPRHLAMLDAGATLIGNGNGSHHEIGKQADRLARLRRATAGGAAYAYANLLGCDGGRLYFDGGSMVVAGGELVAMGEQYAMGEVHTVVATVDVRPPPVREGSGPHGVAAQSGAGEGAADEGSFRIDPRASARHDANANRATTKRHSNAYPRIAVRGFALGTPSTPPTPTPAAWIEPSPAEQLARSGAIWLWDQLRRSAQRCGFFLAVSGGADSSAVASITALLCRMLAQAARGEGGAAAQRLVVADLARIAPRASPSDERSLCEHLLHLAFMGSIHNSAATRERAAALAQQLGAHFTPVEVDAAQASIVQAFVDAVGLEPTYGKFGGTHHENNMLSQAFGRTRMAIAYTLATAGPWARGSHGTLLVLGSANSDEHNRGYNDRYDCSAADINPIGSADKALVCETLRWCAAELGAPALLEAAEATPLSETEPEEEDATDEADMGMSYAMLTRLGSLRKATRLGPLGAYHALRDGLDAEAEVEMARQVKLFFFYNGQFRHLMTSMPPAMHATDYDPDDNRHDLRPFLVNCRWPRQFRAIDEALAARGLTASLPQTTWADGPMQVPRTMGGHFLYPRRSNVELGHRWDGFPDPPGLAVVADLSETAARCGPPPAAECGLADLSEQELNARIRALQDERDRRRRL